MSNANDVARVVLTVPGDDSYWTERTEENVENVVPNWAAAAEEWLRRRFPRAEVESEIRHGQGGGVSVDDGGLGWAAGAEAILHEELLDAIDFSEEVLWDTAPEDFDAAEYVAGNISRQ